MGNTTQCEKETPLLETPFDGDAFLPTKMKHFQETRTILFSVGMIYCVLCLFFGVLVQSNQAKPSEYNTFPQRLVALTDLTLTSGTWPLVMQQIVEIMERKGYMDTNDWNAIIQQIRDPQQRQWTGDKLYWRASNSSSNSSSSVQPGQIEVRCIEKNTMTYRFSCPSPPIDAGIFSGTISCGG